MKQIIRNLLGYKGRHQELSTVSRPIDEKTSGATSEENKKQVSGHNPYCTCTVKSNITLATKQTTTTT